MSTRDEAERASHYLDAWAVDDFDGFHDAMLSITTDADGLMDELREREGDARSMVEHIGDEYEHLASLVRGSLSLARGAIELALSGSGADLASRREAIRALLDRPD